MRGDSTASAIAPCTTRTRRENDRFEVPAASWYYLAMSRIFPTAILLLAFSLVTQGAKTLDMPVDWTDQPDSKSSARLINLSLLYLAGIAELRQEKRRLKVSPGSTLKAR